MRDFVNTYKQDANEAKRNYYMQKLNFDVKGTKGRKGIDAKTTLKIQEIADLTVKKFFN